MRRTNRRDLRRAVLPMNPWCKGRTHRWSLIIENDAGKVTIYKTCRRCPAEVVTTGTDARHELALARRRYLRRRRRQRTK